MQYQPAKKKSRKQIIDLRVQRDRSTTVNFKGKTYQLKFASDHSIYDATVTKVEEGIFKKTVHGEKKRYTLHLVINGFLGPNSSTLVTFDVYGYDSEITHLEDQSQASDHP